MNFLIRADASFTIGTGHVMRCLTLATRIREMGGTIFFASQDSPGNLIDYIRGKGFQTILLSRIDEPENEIWQKADLKQFLQAISKIGISFDWVIVDHYRIGEDWETGIRKKIPRVMAIDDMADRKHDCDIILDQNLTRHMLHRYDRLVPAQCRKFLGPKFAILREEFRKTATKALPRTGEVKNIFVFFGGSDPTNETEKTLQAVEELNKNYPPHKAKPGTMILGAKIRHKNHPDFNVLVGSSNPKRKEIENYCKRLPNVTFHPPVDDLTRLMTAADLALGTPGTTSWERCILGLPTILVVTAENQKEIAKSLHTAGAAWNLGNSEYVSHNEISGKISELISNPESVHAASVRALKIMQPGPDAGMNRIISTLFSTL